MLDSDMRFRKKPVIIEAVQWLVSIESEVEIKKLGCNFVVGPNPDFIYIETLEGIMEASPFDWIIKGIKGECYPCKPDIFNETYEKAE